MWCANEGNSLRTATVIAGVLGRAGERGQKRRLKDAELGEVTWRNPTEIAKFMEIQAMIQAAEKQSARDTQANQRRASREVPAGVMDDTQLEAFQLLQNLERERRSGGWRRKGGDDD